MNMFTDIFGDTRGGKQQQYELHVLASQKSPNVFLTSVITDNKVLAGTGATIEEGIQDGLSAWFGPLPGALSDMTVTEAVAHCIAHYNRQD
jgi:hypothetical protein